MRYSTEPVERRYAKVYVILSFAANLGKCFGKKFSQIPPDQTINAFETTASKRATQKETETTDDLIGNEIIFLS